MPVRADSKALRGIQRRWDANPTWPMKRNCANCKRIFFSFTAWQRFCCPSCASDHGERQA
jgi:protein-arginine kinase activator protein McsA